MYGDPHWVGERARWKGLCSIVMVEREATVDGETSAEKAYYLTTRRRDAARLGELVRRTSASRTSCIGCSR